MCHRSPALSRSSSRRRSLQGSPMTATPANLPRAALALVLAASLIAGCAVLGPFSGPRPRSATVIPASPPPPAPVPSPVYPAPEVQTAPAPMAPPPSLITQLPPTPAPIVEIPGTAETIYLVLPLQSPRYGAAAAAVEAGFRAAATVAGSESHTRVIGH